MRVPSFLFVLLCATMVHGQQPPAPPPARPPVGQIPAPDRAPAQPTSTLSSVHAASGPSALTADPQSPFWKDVTGVWIERRIDTHRPLKFGRLKLVR